MEHCRCQNHHDAPSSWLGRAGTGPRAGADDAGDAGEACSCRSPARRAGYQPPGSAERAPDPSLHSKRVVCPRVGASRGCEIRAVRPGGWLGLLPRGGGSHGRRMASHALWDTVPQPLGPSRPNDRRRRRLMRRNLGSTRKTVPGLVREWQDSMAGNGGVAEATDRPCVAWPGCQMVRLPVPEGDRMRDFGTLTGLVRDT
jgi:hypothetical protein